MAEININMTCDLQHAVKVQYLDGNMFSQDAAANTINIEVTDGGAPAEIGGTVSANVIRPDGGTVAVTGGTIDGNIVSITLPAACYALVGMITIVVKLTDESTVTTLAAAVAYVYQSSTDTVVDPGTVVSSIQDLIDAIDTAVASIPADYSSLWTSLAPPFSSSTAYTAGQYVTYDGGMYRFTKNHAAGSWASGDVATVNLGSELSDVKSALDETIDVVKTNVDIALILEQGGINSSTGANTNTNKDKRLRTATYYPVEFGFSVIVPEGFEIYICFYKGETYLRTSGAWLSGTNSYSTGDFDNIRFVVRNTSDTNLTPASVTTDIILTEYRPDNIQNRLNVTNDSIGNEFEQVTGNRALVFIPGVYSSKSTTGIGEDVRYALSGNYVCAISPCVEGDVFFAHIYGYSGANRGYFVCDSNMKCLSRLAASTEVNGNFTITDENAAFIVFNNRLASLASGYFAYKGMSIKDTVDALLTNDGNIGNQISEIRTAIGEVAGAVITPDETNNYFWNNETGTAVKTAYSNYRASDPVAVVPGESYRVFGRQGSSKKADMVLIVDENYKILTKARGTNLQVDSVDVQIPEGAAYMLITSTSTHPGQYCKLTLAPNNSVGVYGFEDKNIAIIGDSISTNGNWSADNPLGNVPEIVIQAEDVGIELSAYATYNDIGTTVGGHEIVSADVGTEITFTPVEGDIGKAVGKPANYNSSSVKTWWEVAQDSMGFNAIPVCWSGASITDHEADKEAYKASYAFHPAQIRKCGIRTPGSMTRTAPDMVIIYRGTNDFSHSSDITYDDDPNYPRLHYDLTAYQPDGYPEADTYTEDGKTRYDFIAGMLMTIEALRTAYPEAKIVLCTFNYFKRLKDTYPGKPTRNGVNTLEQYNKAVRDIAGYANCAVIDFAKDGITYENAIDDYYQDTNSQYHWANHTHPTAKGHRVMGNRALRDMMTFNSMT